jgi:surface antigen
MQEDVPMLRKTITLILSATMLTGLAVSPGAAQYRDRDRERDRWDSRYQRTYSSDDDPYYRDCRQQVNPGSVVAGAVLGGLLGSAVGNRGSRGVSTAAGIVLGGTLGATLGSDLDCEDRSYAYDTYGEGFRAERPNQTYNWRNPDSGNYGAFYVGQYYNDPDGFRCATYSQTIYVRGRLEEARGHACRQPDGTWVIVD